MNESTPERRVAALVYSIVRSRFDHFHRMNPQRRDNIHVPEFLDYDDFLMPLSVVLDKEFLLKRLGDIPVDDPKRTPIIEQLEKVNSEIRQLIARLQL
jgi:hypothetical protein